MSSRIITVPNLLTVFRMVLIPVFVSLLFYQRFLLALAVFIGAGLTDALDGLLELLEGQLLAALGIAAQPLDQHLQRVGQLDLTTPAGRGLTKHAEHRRMQDVTPDDCQVARRVIGIGLLDQVDHFDDVVFGAGDAGDVGPAQLIGARVGESPRYGSWWSVWRLTRSGPFKARTCTAR